MMEGYGTDLEFQEWLESQGLELPDDAPPVSGLRLRGSLYLDAVYEGKLQCSRRTGGFEQDFAWPRTGHKIRGQLLPPDLIPKAWILASYRAAWLEAVNPGWASGGVDAFRRTKREKAGDVEREFFDPRITGGEDIFGGNRDTLIDGMISGLFCGSGRTFLFEVI